MNREELIDYILNYGNEKDKSLDFSKLSDSELRQIVQRIMSEDHLKNS
jgi:hypothetical protein